MATKLVGSTNVDKMLFKRRTISPKKAYEKNVYGLHFESYFNSLIFDVLWEIVDCICEESCSSFLSYYSDNLWVWDLFSSSL